MPVWAHSAPPSGRVLLSPRAIPGTKVRARKICVSLHGVAQATVPRISASHAARWRPPALAKALVPLSDRRACLFCECTSRAAPLMVVSAVHHFRYHHTEIMTGFYLDQLSFVLTRRHGSAF